MEKVMMQFTRRKFLELSALSAGSACALPGCCALGNRGKKQASLGLQLWSLHRYIGKQEVGMARALSDVATIGYKGVEFAGYYGHSAKELKKMLDDNGLVACGTHVQRGDIAPDKLEETCAFNLAFGNSLIICPGGGNYPPNGGKTSQATDDFVKRLCDFYNRAAEQAASYGCKVGLHNHTWEFAIKMQDGTTYWDYFFGHTSPAVQMEQDVGWTAKAGFDPAEQYRKYPHRSIALHAKENGFGAKDYEGIVGHPGEGVKGVDWDALFNVTDADGVEWYIVECEGHFESLYAVKPSFEFFKSKGRA